MKNLLILCVFPVLFGMSSGDSVNPPCYKADIIFIIDYSASMSGTIRYYEPWLRGTAGELPLSHQLKAGLLFFSEDVCSVQRPLTDDKLLLDQKIMEGRQCPSTSTFLESAIKRADEMFDYSEKERGENVPRIVVLVTDFDVSDHVETCEAVYSEMSEVFFVLMDMSGCSEKEGRFELVFDCFMNNGIVFDGFVWVYEDLLKQFDPCM